MTEGLRPVETDGLRIEPVADGEAVLIRLLGSLDAVTTAVFQVFLDQLHAESLRLHLRRVQLDCGQLYFVHSQGVRCLVQWIARVKQLETARRYEIVFCTHPDLNWQKRSLDAVVRYAPDLVRFER